MKKLIVFLVIIVLLIFGYIYYNNNMKDNQKETEKTKEEQEQFNYVQISINPDLELKLDSENKVVEVLSINEDADILLSDLNLVGMTAEEATEKVVDAAIDTGYIDEYSDANTISITSYNNDETEKDTLEKSIINKVKAHLEDKKVYAVLMSKSLGEELKDEASSYNISNGKMLLIEEAIALNPELKIEDLVDKQISEIQSEIKNCVNERHEALKMELSELKVQWQEQKQQQIEATKENKQKYENQLWDETKNQYNGLTDQEKTEKKQEVINNIKDQIKQNVQNRKNA